MNPLQGWAGSVIIEWGVASDHPLQDLQGVVAINECSCKMRAKVSTDQGFESNDKRDKWVSIY